MSQQEYPKVSIIMSVYNAEKTLSKAIDSILSQTYANWEFIICDDCSTDNSLRILLDYQSRFPDRIIVLKNTVNSQLSYSLNKCLERATGYYIARMDADDISDQHRIEKQVTYLQANINFQLVGCSLKIFDGKTVTGVRYYKEIPDKKDLLRNKCFAHATILTYKYVYDKLNGYVVSKRTTRGQDRDLWFRFFAEGYQGANLKEPLYTVLEDAECYKRKKYIYRIHSFQTTIKGLKMLHFPFRYYCYAFVPLITGLVPDSILKRLHRGTK